MVKQRPPVLSVDEVERLAEKLAMILECDSASISLLLLLLDHLERLQTDALDFNSALSTIKHRLFINTSESYSARREFETRVIAKRGKLLGFRGEKTA